jgi:hypothetical protein
VRLFVSALTSSHKTECGARQLLASFAVRAAPFALLILTSAYAVSAQDVRPDFVWQGQVDGLALLYLRGDKLEVQIQQGGPITGQQYRFSHPLPATREEVRVRVLEGRGYVHVVEQPRIDNQFTLVVSIEDRQPGSSFYSIAMNWDSSGRSFEPKRAGERIESIAWSGRVDEEAMVSCQARACTSAVTRGAPVAHERFKLSRPLPNQQTEVTLADKQGRGEIRLVGQPSERNHYTARVSIRDPQPGSSDYSFKLEWTRTSGKQPAPLPTTGRALLWSGTVTGRVRVTVRGGAAFSQALDSSRLENARAEVLSPLPARSDLEPVIKVLRGRGRVEIVERPTEQNNYQLTLEIIDPGPGSDAYEIEADW